MSYLLNINEEEAWNYKDPTAPNYMPEIVGTLVAIEEVQSTNFTTREPEWFSNGNPKLNLKFIIQGQSGNELPWIFNPKGIAAVAIKKAVKAYDPNMHTMADIGGCMVRIKTHGSTKEYHANNPRPWEFEILGPGTAPFRGVKEWTPSQAPQQMQQQQQGFAPQAAQPQQNMQPQMGAQPMQPAMQGGYYAAPTAQQNVPPSPVNREFNFQPQENQFNAGMQGQPAQAVTDFHSMIPQEFQQQPQQQTKQQAQPQGTIVANDGMVYYDKYIPF